MNDMAKIIKLDFVNAFLVRVKKTGLFLSVRAFSVIGKTESELKTKI